MGGNGGCDGLDLFDLMADVVPNPNMARQRATSGMSIRLPRQNARMPQVACTSPELEARGCWTGPLKPWI